MSSITITTPLTSPRELRASRRPVGTVPPHGQIRLTRRGRIVLFVAALIIVLGAAVLLGAGSVATSTDVPARTTTTMIVGEGDTLWDVASTVAGSGNVSEMVGKIQQMNGLDDGMLRVGQRIRVPKI